MKTEIPEFVFTGKPLEEKDCGILMQFFFAAQAGKEGKLTDAPPEIAKTMPVQIFLKRLEVYGLKFSVSEFFMCMSMLTMVRTPGDTMILLRLCYQYWKKTGKEFLTVADWCEMFPMGTPTEEERRVMWDSQKDANQPLGNMVDNMEFWK